MLFIFLTLLAVFVVLFLNLAFEFSVETLYNFFVVCVFLLLPSIISLFFRFFIPKETLNGKSKFFQQKKYEKNLYNKIKVKKWKHIVPNCGNVGKSISCSPQSSLSKENLEYIIYQTCLGEIVHSFCVVTCFFSMILLTFLKPFLFFNMILPIGIIYIFINILPIFIQRYNRPRIFNLLREIEKTEKI